MAKLLACFWPGHVRELKNLVERLVATVDADLVRVEHLPAGVSGAAPAPSAPVRGAVPENAAQLREAKRRLKEKVFEEVERAFILNALDRAGWNVSQAAARAGMQRTFFHALMRKCGVRKGD
jgi:two-component system response regulator AtoC